MKIIKISTDQAIPRRIPFCRPWVASRASLSHLQIVPKNQNLSFFSDQSRMMNWSLREKLERLPCLDDMVIVKGETEEGRTLGEIKEEGN